VGVRLGVVAIAVLVAVTGCSGGSPSTDLPAGSASPQSSSPPSNPPSTAATTPSATPTAPALPAAAREDTPTGAESFARYYIEVLDYAYQSGDTKLLRKPAQCPGCNAVADGIDKFVASGGRYEGGRLKVVEAESVKHVEGSADLVSLVYSRSERELVSAGGERERVDNAPALRVLVTERRERTAWLITNIQTLS
jgi:Family of unknown function (DUF6318)